MDNIVDIQFFKDSKNIVVPKEICVIDLASESIALDSSFCNSN